MKDIFRFTYKAKFENPSLIVGWDKDAGRLSPKVIEYLNKKLNAGSFCDIEPVDFFSLAGVAVERDTAQFPECKFYYCERNDLVIFKANEPEFERYRFLDAVSDLAQHHFGVKHLYTIGGTISSTTHSNTRKILAVYNKKELQQELNGYGMEDMTWQGTPAISSYLLWVAERKGIPGVSLWTQIPFYLAACEDFQAIRATLSFLDNRFSLELDLKELDEQEQSQNIKIDRLRQEDSEINRCIGALENGQSLNQEEQLNLIKAVSEFLESGKS
ncbi:MAG: hypothetical protein A2167_06940 [Planctomycetes bacterium RBG_13_46_10]|nr:MAG: hypothetical protein A2167_06940 [Planctomycetes bacterium RBG_13_46_10]